MTKKDIATKVAVALGKNVTDCHPIVTEAINQIRKAVVDGEIVYLRGFGTLSIKRRNKRRARHIRAGVEITIEAHDVPYFKVSKEFVKDVSLKPLTANDK